MIAYSNDDKNSNSEITINGQKSGGGKKTGEERESLSPHTDTFPVAGQYLQVDHELTNKEPSEALKKVISTRVVAAEGFELKEVTEEEMTKIMKMMNGKKSCGLDWICGYSLKSVSETLEPELRHLVNLTIRNHSYVDA